MATSTPTVRRYLSTDALWRSWVQAIHDGMVLAGWVQTADTGQINLTTATRAAAGAIRGYEVWRPNDAVQATNPFFLKIGYGNAGAGQASGKLQFTFGYATDGAGNLAAPSIGPLDIEPMSVAPATPTTATAYISGDTSRVAMAMGLGSGEDETSWGVFSFERMHADDGTDEAGMLYGIAAPFGGKWGLFPGGGYPIAAEGYTPALAPTTELNARYEDDVSLFPIYPFNGRFANPMKGLAGYMLADISALSTITATDPYGDPRPMLALDIRARARGDRSSSPNASLLMRWE
jgi:hypothetical protein